MKHRSPTATDASIYDARTHGSGPAGRLWAALQNVSKRLLTHVPHA